MSLWGAALPVGSGGTAGKHTGFEKQLDLLCPPGLKDLERAFRSHGLAERIHHPKSSQPLKR
jgi:hypothetical protein